MSRSEARVIQTIQLHHPSLSPLPLLFKSIGVMMSFPHFSFILLLYFVIKKRDRLTLALCCTEKKGNLLRKVCVLTNFHTKLQRPTSTPRLDGQSTPLLEKFTNFQSHSYLSI